MSSTQRGSHPALSQLASGRVNNCPVPAQDMWESDSSDADFDLTVGWERISSSSFQHSPTENDSFSAVDQKSNAARPDDWNDFLNGCIDVLPQQQRERVQHALECLRSTRSSEKTLKLFLQSQQCKSMTCQ